MAEQSTQEKENKANELIVNNLLDLTEKYRLDLDMKTPEAGMIAPILKQLTHVLTDPNISPEEKIKAFYKYLEECYKGDCDPKVLDSLEPKGQASLKAGKVQNIAVIKLDDSIATQDFLAGIALFIVATLVTGIIPGIIVAGFVYTITGQRLDLAKAFDTKSEQYEKEIKMIKAKVTFFEQQPEDIKGKKQASSNDESPKSPQ